jgi:SagB-type dehydrogenase family enzyme
VLLLGGSGSSRVQERAATTPQVTSLPAPAIRGAVSVEEALHDRRSVREFGSRALRTEEIGQLLWAAQGVTHGDGLRTTPSAGALYPLEIYVATAAGLSHYLPVGHRLAEVTRRDVRPALQRAALGQSAVGDAPAVFAITAVPARTAARYGRERGERYVQLEAGHAAQNLLVQAVGVGLVGVPIGAFDDARVLTALNAPAGETAVYLIPVGAPR